MKRADESALSARIAAIGGSGIARPGKFRICGKSGDYAQVAKLKPVPVPAGVR